MATPIAESGLTALRQAPTSELVADQVRDRIADGAFAQGSVVNETMLANVLGVSRGPVREALQRLVQEGLLINERHQKLRVPELTAEDVQDIYRVRGVLEMAAIEAVIESDDPAFVTQGEALVERMAASMRRGDAAEVTAADLDFHHLLITSSRSARLARAFATLTVETQMCLNELLSLDPLQEATVELHSAIVDAVRQRDVAAARAALERHNEVTLSHYFSSEKRARTA